MNVLYILFVLDTLNLSVFLPVFSAFVRSLGGTPSTLGFINSSSALITLLWNLIVGSLSDQLGRKGLLSKCMIASAVGSLILCFSSSSLLLVFIGRLVGALGSPVVILLRSTVADTFKTDEEKKTFLNKSAPIISLAFLIGSVSSGFLSEVKNGYSLTFLLMSILMGLASIITHYNLPAENKPKTQTKNTSSLAARAVNELKMAFLNIRSISWPRYKELFLMKAFYDLSISTIFSNVGLLLLTEFNVKGRVVGYVFLMIGICRIVSNLLKLKLKKTMAGISEDSKIFQGGIVLIISYLGMGLCGSIYSFLVFLGIMCLARAFMDTTLSEMIAMKTEASDRGKVMATYDNLFPFSMFIAPVISGIVAQAYGQRILLGFAAIPISVTALVAYQQKKKTE